ncbi:hypothetical protein P4S72_20565 [Vibrio sp. PP-XX7]
MGVEDVAPGKNADHDGRAHDHDGHGGVHDANDLHVSGHVHGENAVES